MRNLSKKIHKQIEKVEAGKLKVEELEELVNDAKDLYEKLVILKFKAYEKYGAPKETVEEIEEEEEIVEVETIEEETEEVVEPKEDSSFDFTGESEEEEEQPAFDFSISEKEESFPKDEDIKNVAPQEESSESSVDQEENFPEDSNTKGGSTFKDSHVEKHEPEDENSLNQKLKDEEELSLRKKLQNTPIKDLKDEISIAKKFEYITFMFEGKNETYEKAIEVLNSCKDGEEARDKLNEYSTKFNWDLENKSIIKFVELVERRYL